MKQRRLDSILDLVRRRSCHAGRVISLTDRWSNEWCKNAISWHSHSQRSNDSSLPLNEILSHKTVSLDFLVGQRARRQTDASKPSVIGTRLFIGKGRVRRCDGIEYAKPISLRSVPTGFAQYK